MHLTLAVIVVKVCIFGRHFHSLLFSEIVVHFSFQKRSKFVPVNQSKKLLLIFLESGKHYGSMTGRLGGAGCL